MPFEVDSAVRARFVVDCEIELYHGWNSDDEAWDDETRLFRVGEEIEFTVIDHPTLGDGTEAANLLNVQFSNGALAFSVNVEWLEEIV